MAGRPARTCSSSSLRTFPRAMSSTRPRPIRPIKACSVPGSRSLERCSSWLTGALSPGTLRRPFGSRCLLARALWSTRTFPCSRCSHGASRRMTPFSGPEILSRCGTAWAGQEEVGKRHGASCGNPRSPSRVQPVPDDGFAHAIVPLESTDGGASLYVDGAFYGQLVNGRKLTCAPSASEQARC